MPAGGMHARSSAAVGKGALAGSIGGAATAAAATTAAAEEGGVLALRVNGVQGWHVVEAWHGGKGGGGRAGTWWDR